MKSSDNSKLIEESLISNGVKAVASMSNGSLLESTGAPRRLRILI